MKQTMTTQDDWWCSLKCWLYSCLWKL